MHALKVDAGGGKKQEIYCTNDGLIIISIIILIMWHGLPNLVRNQAKVPNLVQENL